MFIVSINGEKVSQLVDERIEVVTFSEEEVDGVIKVNDSAFGTYNYERSKQVFSEIIDNCTMNKTYYQMPKE